jgi:hypothetical protein
MLDPYPREEQSILEEPTISDLGTEALVPYEPPITNLSVPIIAQVYPYECQIVSQAAMETNVVTSSGNYHIPSMTITTRDVPPSNQSLSVSTTSTSGNRLILSIAEITAPFTQSVTGHPFSYGMLGFDTKYDGMHIVDQISAIELFFIYSLRRGFTLNIFMLMTRLSMLATCKDSGVEEKNLDGFRNFT